MSGQDRLERGYRRVLACYPRSFRGESEEEILAVLLDTAAEGQTRVGLGEAADLIRGALRMRLRPALCPPRAVRAAVRLMCAGAVAELAAVVTMAVTAASAKAALAKEPGLTAAQWHQAVTLLTFREAAAAVTVGLWLLMAWLISQGRDAARFAFSAFFALITLTMLIALAQHGAAYAPADMIAGAAIWLIALVTMALIFTRPSNTYYRQAARPPAAHAAG
jgi:hypothetical protein